MKKYEVDFTDFRTGATSAVDTIVAADDYTAEDFVVDCMANADSEWNDMLCHGEVSLVEVED